MSIMNIAYSIYVHHIPTNTCKSVYIHHIQNICTYIEYSIHCIYMMNIAYSIYVHHIPTNTCKLVYIHHIQNICTYIEYSIHCISMMNIAYSIYVHQIPQNLYTSYINSWVFRYYFFYQKKCMHYSYIHHMLLCIHVHHLPKKILKLFIYIHHMLLCIHVHHTTNCIPKHADDMGNFNVCETATFPTSKLQLKETPHWTRLNLNPESCTVNTQATWKKSSFAQRRHFQTQHLKSKPHMTQSRIKPNQI